MRGMKRGAGARSLPAPFLSRSTLACSSIGPEAGEGIAIPCFGSTRCDPALDHGADLAPGLMLFHRAAGPGAFQFVPDQDGPTLDAALVGLRQQGSLLAPGRKRVVHLDVGAPGRLLDPIAAACGLEPQLGLTERVLCTHDRGAVSTPQFRQGLRNSVPQNCYAGGHLARRWYRCKPDSDPSKTPAVPGF